MSLYDYRAATSEPLMRAPFDALIMAAVLRADTGNLMILRRAFPNLVVETLARFDAPGGVLPYEREPKP